MKQPSNRADLLAKIRKCLALAKSAGEHEAAAALSKARELMDQYGVDETDIALSAVGEATARGGDAERPPTWELTLIASVTRAIPTKAIRVEDGVRFIGVSPGPEIAAYAFTALYRQLKAARKAYIAGPLKRCTVARKRVRADLFCEGWATAVYRTVARLYGVTELDAVVRAYLEKTYPLTTTVAGRSAKLGGRVAENDRDRGWTAGRQVELQRGVGGSGDPLRIAGGAA